MTLLDNFNELFRDYYREDIAKLAQSYPKDRQSLYVEAKDVWRYDSALLEDWKNEPAKIRETAEEALPHVDIPIDIDLEGAHVRLTDSNDYLDRLGVGELYAEHETNLIAVRGRVGQVTGARTKLTVAAFECQRCGTITRMPQPDTDFQEPHECQGCERQGPFHVNFNQSERINQQKLKLEEPPHEQTNGSGQEILVYCHNDLIHEGGENGLVDTAGETVTIIGEYLPDETDLQGRGNVTPTYDCYFKAHSIVFDDDRTDEIDVDKHRDEVNQYASRADAIDVFRESIDPGLTITDKWDMATLMATGYAFGAPRIDPEDGDMVRGDLHMLFVSDPGMRKSVFADKLAELLPNSEIRQATGMSSDVGLTAAAQQDEFGDGGWSLSPGALPRANGGHLIIDEIDKGPGLGGIHDALEGSQELKIDKAGIQATLATRVGFMALGNPTEGRFDPYEPIAEQIDLDPALMSRFDLIVTMSDEADRDMDTEIATGVLDSVDESARLEYGDMETSEAEAVTPEVPREVMKAWVKIAREEINPLLSEDAKNVLRDYYVDTRQLNDEESDKPPATARTLLGGIRLSMAFARAELSEEVTERHAELAKEVSKAVVAQNFDPESGEWDADRTTETPSSQQERVEAIEMCLRSDGKLTLDEIADRTGISERKIEHRLEKLRNRNPAPVVRNGDEYRWIA